LDQQTVVQVFQLFHKSQEVHMKPLWPMCVLQWATEWRVHLSTVICGRYAHCFQEQICNW